VNSLMNWMGGEAGDEHDHPLVSVCFADADVMHVSLMLGRSAETHNGIVHMSERQELGRAARNLPKHVPR